MIEESVRLGSVTSRERVDVIKAVNDVLAFMLEIAALAAVALWASRSDPACRLASSRALALPQC
jgi:hypothetical protein